MSEDTRRIIQQKILTALSRREYGYEELCVKFGQDFPRDDIVSVLETFVEKGWQSDKRYVQSYINSAVSRGKGPLLIRQYLRQQQIPDQLIEDELQEHNFFALATEVYQKKYTDAPKDAKERAKQQRFLIGRGFSFDHINEALHHHD